MTRSLAQRFIAGDDVDEAMDVARELAGGGARVSLDYVGEYSETADEARAAAKVFREVLDRVAQEDTAANISVKSTLLGRLVDPQLCEELLDELLEAAEPVDAHVGLDMEGHELTEDTVRLAEAMAARGHRNLGVAVQAYLHRTREDLVRLTEAGATVRLTKGAYAEPEHLAYQDTARVDAEYDWCTTWLLENGIAPRIATHDHERMAHLKSEIARTGRDRDDVEIQMLYGVRTDMQQALVRDGYRVCVYVPFGDAWYPYFMRRLAERPANLLFFGRAALTG